MTHVLDVQACERHKTAPTASAALGRALLGTLLMGTFKGEDESTQVETYTGLKLLRLLDHIA